MSHSHMLVEHLLKQVETYRANRSQKGVRPEWLTSLIHDIAELFEPLSGVGRVGFDCHFDDDRWNVRMYLGRTEIVGGKDDGQAKHTNFEFDLQPLLGRFTSVSQFRWKAFPNRSETEELQSDPANFSHIVIAGDVKNNPLHLQIDSVAPEDIGPGLRQYPNGYHETV